MARALRNYLASMTIAAAGFLGACNSNTSPPVDPPGPDPEPTYPDCLEETVTAMGDASNLGLDIDVSVFDTNENRGSWDADPVECYTVQEQEGVEEFARLRAEGAPREALERIIADHPVVGPGIVQAIRMDWEATKRDQEHVPSVAFYDRGGRIGWVPLEQVIGGTFPARSLQEAGGSSPYPVDDLLWGVGLPDRDPAPDSFRSFLEERGLTCVLPGRGEDYPQVSEFQSSGDFNFEVDGFPPIPIRNGTLDGGVVEMVSVFERSDPLIGEYTDSNILVRYDVHPDDSSMLGFDSHQYFVLYAHMSPLPLEQRWSVEDYDWLQEGSSVDTGDLIAFVNYFHARGTRPIADITWFVPEDLGTTPPFQPDTPYGPVQTLDVFDASRYPADKAPSVTSPRFESPEDLFDCS